MLRNRMPFLRILARLMLVVVAGGAIPNAPFLPSYADSHDYSTTIRTRRPADDPVSV